MTEPIAGVLAGFLVAGGWLSLIGFSAILSIAMGIWRIESAYFRLSHKIEEKVQKEDIRQIALAEKGPRYSDAYADWLMDTDTLPPRKFVMYLRAIRWELYIVGGFALGTRLGLEIFS